MFLLLLDLVRLYFFPHTFCNISCLSLREENRPDSQGKPNEGPLFCGSAVRATVAALRSPLTRRRNVNSCQVIMWPSPCAGLSQPKVNMQLNYVKTRRPTPFTGASALFEGPARKEVASVRSHPPRASRHFGTVSVPHCSLFGTRPDLPAVCSSELPPAVYGRWRNTIQPWRG